MPYRRCGAAWLTTMTTLVVVLLPAARGFPSRLQDRRPAAAHMVLMSGTAFMPASLTVTAGDTVTWVNDDFFPHTATSSRAAFDSGSIDAGGRWTLTTAKAGEYPYVCAVHPTMKGTLRVNERR
jgi:plastocyanin